MAAGRMTGRARPSGPAMAAILAAGVGSFALGLVTTLAEASAGVASALRWSAAVGPLSGKTSVAVIAWLVAWILLHAAWRDREVRVRVVAAWTLVLIALGLVLLFPPFFELFAAG